MNRKSVRAYEGKAIGAETKDEVLMAILRAPTAGNLMLYSIIEVTDQKIKNTLSKTCDNQPLMAKALWVLLFLADYQRWFDYFIASGVEQHMSFPFACSALGIPPKPRKRSDTTLSSQVYRV